MQLNFAQFLRKKIAVIFVFFTLFLFNFSQVNAQQLGDAINDQLQDVVQSLENCPDAIKSLYMKFDPQSKTWEYDYQLIWSSLETGALVVSSTPDKKFEIMSCSSTTALDKIVGRVVGLIFGFAGLLLILGFMKIALGLSFGSDEAKNEAKKGLGRISLYTIGFFSFYSLVVFLVVGVLGVGNNTDKPEYNILCQQRIIVSLVFDSESLKCGATNVDWDTYSGDSGGSF